MLCPSCKALIPDDSVFCSKCGSSVGDTSAPPCASPSASPCATLTASPCETPTVSPCATAAVPSPAPTAPSCVVATAPERKRRRWPWITALAVAGALALCGVAALAYTQIEQIVGALVLPESSPSQYGTDSATAPADDPIVGRWQAYAASTSEHELTLLGAGVSDDFYIEFMPDGTLVASLDGSETYDGVWVANGTIENEPRYDFTMVNATWTCVMTTRIDGLDTALVAIANNVGGQECSVTYRRG